MEALVPILIGIAFIVLQAIAAGNKKKNASSPRPGGMFPPQSYSSPYPETDISNPFDQLFNKGSETGRPEEEIGTYKEEETEVKGMLYRNYDKLLKEKWSGSEFSFSKTTLPDNTDHSEEQHEDTPVHDTDNPRQWLAAETFDGRKAIIYSEIMRPKFED